MLQGMNFQSCQHWCFGDTGEGSGAPTVFTVGSPEFFGTDFDLCQLLSQQGIGFVIDARPAHFSEIEALRQACSHRQCVLFEGPQTQPDDCRRHVVNKLRSCGIEVHHVSAAETWSMASGSLGLEEQQYSEEYARHHGNFEAGEQGSWHDEGTAASTAPFPVAVIPPKNGVHKGTLVYLHPFGHGNTRYLQAQNIFAQNDVRIVLPLAACLPVASQGGRKQLSWFNSVPSFAKSSASNAQGGAAGGDPRAESE
ncbi:unnamed protein product, partial [Polarella glacialis]